MLVDSHCHLDFPDFAEELDSVVERARDAGVRRMLTICTHVTRFERVHAVAQRYEDVFCTVGIHPHEAGSEPPVTAKALCDLAEQFPKVVGFGETGLDYYYDHSPRDEQRRSFRAHLEAARMAGLPVIVHTRDAEEDTIAMLREASEQGPFTGVIHCFSGSRSLADAALALGLYISVSGIVTFKKAEELRDTLKRVPLDYLLVETDSPYLAPVPKRGKRNEPAFTAFTAAALAELKGVSPKVLTEATTANFHRLFTKVNALTDAA